jgi:hypothetical protein
MLAMKKITKYAIPVIVPLLSILYGLADIFGWTDYITGRAHATAGLQRLKHGNGYPETYIYHDEKEFCAMKRSIDRNTRNAQVAVNNKIQPPSLISVDGGLTRRGPTPPEWPINVDTPESAQIMYIYGQERGKGGGTATWVGSILEMRQWIETSRNRERFWVMVVMISILSAWIGIIEARKKTG